MNYLQTLCLFVLYQVSFGFVETSVKLASAKRGSSNLSLSSPVAFEIISVMEEFKEASVPKDFESLIAGAGAEALAGIAGGFFSEKVSGAFGDSRDVEESKSLTASRTAFFGSAGLIRATCVLVGLPSPLDVLISSMIAEATRNFVKAKLQAKHIISQGAVCSQYIKQLELNDFMMLQHTVDGTSTKTHNIDYSDTLAGVSKWMIYDRLITSTVVGSDLFANAIHYFVFGVIASTCAFFIKQIAKESKFEIKTAEIIRFDLQGGILFLMFEEIRQILTHFVPQSFNPKLPFDYVVEGLANDLAHVLLWT